MSLLDIPNAAKNLSRIASALERLANHFDREGASKRGSFVTFDVDHAEDGSKVAYVDDKAVFVEELRRAQWMDETGHILKDDEPIPRPPAASKE